MAVVKLIKARSWSNGKYTATIDNPVVTASDADAETLVATGYFAVTSAPAQEIAADAESSADLSALTVQELTKLAKSIGIDTRKLKRADLIRQISIAQGGSGTMIDLQAE